MGSKQDSFAVLEVVNGVEEHNKLFSEDLAENTKFHHSSTWELLT